MVRKWQLGTDPHCGLIQMGMDLTDKAKKLMVGCLPMTRTSCCTDVGVVESTIGRFRPRRSQRPREKNLHEADPVAFPYNPTVPNEIPIGLQTIISDDDGYVRNGQPLSVTVAVQNNVPDDSPIYVSGGISLTSDAPLMAGQSVVVTDTFANLTARQAFTMPRTITVVGSSGDPFDIATAVDGVFQTAGEPTLGAVMVSEHFTLTVDSDNPSAEFVSAEQTWLQPGQSVVLSGIASDPTSPIARVEVSDDGAQATRQPWGGKRGCSSRRLLRPKAAPHSISAPTTPLIVTVA